MTSEGWMVLCEENGKSRMDIIFNSNENDDLIAHNIWGNEPLSRDSRGVCYIIIALMKYSQC